MAEWVTAPDFWFTECKAGAPVQIQSTLPVTKNKPLFSSKFPFPTGEGDTGDGATTIKNGGERER